MSELHYTVDGPPDAPVVVLGNSLGTTTSLWDAQVPALAAAHRVVRYDHPGHGGSPSYRPSAFHSGSSESAAGRPGSYTMAGLGGGVVALLDELGVTRCSYAGVSIGGMVGMWLAAHAPERIDRLVVCCSSAHLPPPRMWTDRAATVRAHGPGAVAEGVVDRWFTPGFKTRNPEVVAATAAALGAVDAEGYAGCCEAIATMDLRPDLPGIHAPTLVIAGADDPATPPEAHARVIADAVPGARLEVVGDAAHLAVVEQHETVTRLLLDHLGAGGGA